MIQQTIALLIVIFFLSRLLWQKHKKGIGHNEFIFWLVFWAISGLMIIFIKQIDRLVAYVGFSGSGIQILFYLSIAIIFYLLFRIRLRQEKMEKTITEIIRHISINKQ